MPLLDRLAAGEQIKLADLARGNTRVGRLLQRAGVPNTPDLQRILALPSRDWENDPETEELVALLTQHLRVSGGSWTLLPQQAVYLQDAYELGGAFGGLKVGEGKTPLTYLLPTLLESKSSVLLAPGGLLKERGKTDKDFERLAQEFKAPEGIIFISYEQLSDERNEDILEYYRPDLIIPDEARALAGLHHPKVPGCVRRISRYLEKYPETRFCPLDGTMYEDRPMSKYHHLMRWAIGEAMPLPLDWKDASVWSKALDVETPMAARMDLGALTCFGPTREEAFKGYNERVHRTPGIVLTRNPDLAGQSLQIELVEGPNPCKEMIYDVFNGKDPDGNPVDEHDAGRMASELVCGFWYEPDPRPPAPWLEARRRYKQMENTLLESRTKGCDTPLQAELYCAKRGDVKVYQNWCAIRDTYRYRRITRWVSYDVMDYIMTMVEPGTIIWTYYEAPGQLLAERYGLRYFQKDASDMYGPIESAKGETCVASVASCCTGRNLQFDWSRNFFITPPPQDMLEQALGRTHRRGQKQAIVQARFLANNQLYRHKIESLRAAAREGSGTSRLCLADWI